MLIFVHKYYNKNALKTYHVLNFHNVDLMLAIPKFSNVFVLCYINTNTPAFSK